MELRDTAKYGIACNQFKIPQLMYKCVCGFIRPAIEHSIPCPDCGRSLAPKSQPLTKPNTQGKFMTPEMELAVDAMLQNDEDLDTMALILFIPHNFDRNSIETNPASRYISFKKTREVIQEYIDAK